MSIQLIASGSRPWQAAMGYWGLSYVINRTILFDTFNSYRILSNRLKKAGVREDSLRTVILSHEHKDHSGGLLDFLKNNPSTRLYVPNNLRKSAWKKLESLARIEPKPPILQIDERTLLIDIFSTGDRTEIPEQALALRTPTGLILVVGCAHPGIVKMIDRVEEETREKVRGVAGGLHLFRASAEEIRICAEVLKDKALDFLAPTHCTGRQAERTLRTTLPQAYRPTTEGHTFILSFQ